MAQLVNPPLLFNERDLWVTALIFIIIVGGLYFRSQNQSRKLSHIPILAPELGTRGRKNAFRWNAKVFLERGYHEVS